MAVSVQEALYLIEQNIKKINCEILPMEDTLGRVCGEDIFATHFMPRFNNSAMDGYGVIVDDADSEVKVIDTILAGNKKTPKIKKGQCVKIMTGARVPKSVEAIVPQELVETIDKNSVKLPLDIKPYSHIRFVGEDIKNGELLIKKGEDINFAKITLLASQGITHLKVFKQPKVTVFASGEELKLHYEKVKKYQIYNSNTPTLIARIQELGCEVKFIGMAQDSVESIKELIRNSLDSDLIVTSGGVSVGEADFTKEAFDDLGMETIFTGIIVKPGKPTILGKIGKTSILNLPGNPLASSLIFELFGKIILQNLKGSNDIYHNILKTSCAQDLYNKKGRITIIPGYYDGEKFEPSAKRSPGMVNILSKCNSMIVLDENVEIIKENGSLNVLPINWNFFTNKVKDFLTYE